MASEAVSKGLVGLGQWSGKIFNPDYNLSAGGGGGGTQLDSEICASQPERGTWTRPREAAILARLGEASQPGIGAEMPAWTQPANEMHWARGQPYGGGGGGRQMRCALGLSNGVRTHE